MTATVAASYKVRLGEPDSALLGASTGTINLDNDTIKARLLMSNSTAETDLADVTTLLSSDIGTLDETTGTPYTAGGETISINTATYSSANSRAEWAAGADTVFSNHGNTLLPARDLQGVLVEKNNNFVISYHTGGFPKTIPSGGADVRIVWDSTGIVRIA